jgi:polar amino acid transport system substrate-binding protein
MFLGRERRGLLTRDAGTQAGEEQMRATRTSLIAALVALFAAALFAMGCGDDDGDSGGSSGGGGSDLGLIKEGTLTVGTDTPYPPFEIGQPPDITGFDIEIMNGIAKDLGLKPEYTATGFGTIFRDTANGQFDTAAAASDITAEREQVVDFTDPYYLSSTVLIVPKGSDIQSVDDLSGKVLGVQDGTTQQDYAEDETDAGDIRGFPEGPNAVEAMATGQVEAILLDKATGVDAVKKTDGIEIVEEIPTDVFFGFAVAPDNDALREAMNDALDKLKDDGTINDAYQKYFNSDAPDEVINGTNKLLTND